VTPLSAWVGGPFSVVINSPTVQDGGGRIDCAPRQPGCKPLNLARCTDSTPMPISFGVAPGASGLPAYTGTSQVLYAFLGTLNGCVYSTVSGQIGNDPNLLIGTTTSLGASAPFFAGGGRSFTFPDGVSTINPSLPQLAQSGVYTVADMLKTLGVCPPGQGVQMSTYFLCVGVDATASRGINNTAAGTATGTATPATPTTPAANTNGQDPVTYLQFQIDTVPPEPPTIAAVRSLNGRCTVHVDYTNQALDLYAVRVKYSSAPQNLNVPCNLWTEEVHTTPDQNAYGQSGGNLTFTVDHLDNDISYAFCAESEDYMENVSVPSANVLGQPRFECDLFGCYPNTLKTGYCSQTAAPQVWLLALGALGARLWQRRRTQARS
jgi:hypothetical protein